MTPEQFADNYSLEYLRRFEQAVVNSLQFDFPNALRVSPTTIVSDELIAEIDVMLYKEFLPRFKTFHNGYRGNMCQIMASQIFGFLNARGIPADIVIGEVQIFRTLEFDTTLEGLLQDYKTTTHDGGQQLHAWVSVGQDTIIDASISHRMVKNYKVPQEQLFEIFADRATVLSQQFLIRYQPIIVGADFLHKTNEPSPYDVLRVHEESYRLSQQK